MNRVIRYVDDVPTRSRVDLAKLTNRYDLAKQAKQAADAVPCDTARRQRRLDAAVREFIEADADLATAIRDALGLDDDQSGLLTWKGCQYVVLPKNAADFCVVSIDHQIALSL